ncbi:flavohemoglobin expression-modulating QEGLA motif protein [Parapedobacter sp. SGR-10]|uniref:flavohemoglobin expression-modulating QEGLA motif protein n=1 Tax=Parapedobacter sp. SGR-10 TaxID=2710879 RepID=UPI001F111423|nr:tyrosine/phenylalanine carboxypeptidase domain-containing protein [Parapedobacter sp. SGR-10]
MKAERKTLDNLLQKINTRDSFHVQIPIRNKLVFNKITPYLFVYREYEKKDPMLSALVKSEYSYLIIRDRNFDIPFWITPISQKLVEVFGSCLIIEAWAATESQEEDVQVHVARKNALTIAEYLDKQIQTEGLTSSVRHITGKKEKFPASGSPLVNLQDRKNNQILYIGLSVDPSYLTDSSSKVLPIVLRQIREALSRSLSKTFFEFVRIHTLSKPTEFKISHPRELLPLVWEIDQKLGKESTRFDFLLLVTPINTHEAWLQFKKDNYRKAPTFLYRPMPIDPDIVKRNLYNLPIEDLYDPTIAYLFRDKRKELDWMMSMLSERGKEGFMLGSLQLFGNVSEKLLDRAKAILTITAQDEYPKDRGDDIVYAEEFAQLAQQEINYLRAQEPQFNTTIRLRDDIYGVMVNQGVLNISKQYALPRRRVNALLQHEVGTHIVTYFNGKQQPFNLFRLGVPGYEKLQEGLAVMAEYMVDELTNDRLRVLAGRVVTVHHMIAGNHFTDTFSLLVDQYQFDKQTAFQMAMRVYRSGGLTKDALYLQGLIELVSYIKEGNDINLLTMGKIRKDYIPIVQELLFKGILKAPALLPRYLTEPYITKLEKLKNKGIFQMIQ